MSADTDVRALAREVLRDVKGWTFTLEHGDGAEGPGIYAPQDDGALLDRLIAEEDVSTDGAFELIERIVTRWNAAPALARAVLAGDAVREAAARLEMVRRWIDFNAGMGSAARGIRPERMVELIAIVDGTTPIPACLAGEPPAAPPAAPLDREGLGRLLYETANADGGEIAPWDGLPEGARERIRRAAEAVASAVRAPAVPAAPAAPATCRACGASLIEQTATHCWPRCAAPAESGAAPAQREEDPAP